MPCKVSEEENTGTTRLDFLAHGDGVSPSLVSPAEEGPLEPSWLVPEKDEEELGGLSPAVIDTITETRAQPSTFSLHRVVPKVKTHGDIALDQFFPSSKSTWLQ